MIDVGYRWKNANDALWVLWRIEEDKLFFVETPLQTDHLEGLARLADATTTPVAVGEFLQTRHEFRELMDHGHCDVIQPDMGRVGAKDWYNEAVESCGVSSFSEVPASAKEHHEVVRQRPYPL